ncbi:Hint domain-containing protein [Myxococcus sp. K15C18031901]|uniref:Hint domain-containing protein n=1 Tax=Myxococcus dinghuensis TaxID=2906761 RepID=UPI0020A7FCF9|nr:Hint domain-containing protein [Myxococcus dinghuensis]MCP3098899.1 Hint domain-containing protein [Myxococcus dinghuensis]
MKSLNGRSATRVLFVAAWACLMPGCDWILRPPPKPTTTEDQHSAVLEHFNKRLPHEDFVRLDLANNDHYEYAKFRIMEAAAAEAATTQGVQAQAQQQPVPRRDFAKALATLERARAKALQQVPGKKPTEWHCDHFLQVEPVTKRPGNDGPRPLPNETPAAYRVGPYATCAGGATHVFADVTAYATDLSGQKKQVLAKTASEEHDDGTTFDDVAVAVKTPVEKNQKLVVESMMIASNEKTGEEHVTFATLDSAFAAAPVSYTLAHPRYAGTAPSTLNLTTCQLRGGGDCDYAMVSNNGGTLVPFGAAAPAGSALRKTSTPSWTGDPDNFFPIATGTPYDANMIYVPTDLTFDAGANDTGDCLIQTVNPTLTRLRLIKTITGGTCTTRADLSAAFVLPPVGQPRPRTMSMRQLVVVTSTTPDASGSGADCTMARIVNEPVILSATVQTTAICGTSPAAIPRLVTFTSNSMPVSPFKLNVLNSCMAEGTRITLPDGTRAPIETLKVGDKVRASANGRVLTIQDVIFGHENKPLVRLEDDQGHDVRLTEQHPVLLSSGLVVTADKVQVTDKVRTEKGTSTIVAIERLPYTGKVYNLKLGTPQELESLSPSERTMFAEGLLVGDDSMQRELTTPRRASLETSAAKP